MPLSSYPSSARSTVFASKTAKLVLGELQPRQTLHRHKPMELIFAIDGPIELLDETGNVLRGSCFFVPPMCAHALLDHEGRLARIYLSVGYERTSLSKGQGICSKPDTDVALRGEIERFFNSERSPQAAGDLMDRWLTAWIDERDNGPAFDPRVSVVLAYLESQDLPMQASRKSVAELAGLSPTRFAALFVENTGMPLSRYLIWRRVKIALAYLCAGNSVTAAAAYAGFADGAHFSRSCRTTYGYAPSYAMGRAVTEVTHTAFGEEPLAGRHLCLSPHTAPIDPATRRETAPLMAGK